MLQIQPIASTEALHQVFKLTGTIDIKATEPLNLLYVIPENASVVLDFADAPRVNSMGLALLLKLFEHWQKRNIHIQVTNTNRMTATLFKMMNLNHFLEGNAKPEKAAIVVAIAPKIETPIINTPAKPQTPEDPTAAIYHQAKQHYDNNAYSQALALFEQAAQQGHVEAKFYLGLSYAHGYGVDKDHVTAVYWLRQAAEQAHAGGQYNLGVMYGNGYGVSKDYVQAAQWFHKAAQQGNAGGQASLGKMYEYGYGVEKNYATALLWYRKAAAQGHERAIKQLEAFV
jgi:anti-anti-sigma regulatory factor